MVYGIKKECMFLEKYSPKKQVNVLTYRRCDVCVEILLDKVPLSPNISFVESLFHEEPETGP